MRNRTPLESEKILFTGEFEEIHKAIDRLFESALYRDCTQPGLFHELSSDLVALKS